MVEDDKTVDTPADNTAIGVDEPVLNIDSDASAPEPENDKDPVETAETGDEPVVSIDGEEGEGEAKPEVNAPEQYEPFSIPEGWMLEGDLKESVDTTFRELNLSQEAGQKLVDMYVQRMTAEKERELTALADQRRAWRQELRSRPQYETERALARKGANAVVRTSAARDLFQDTWLQDHPGVFDLLVEVGRLLGEDTPLNTGTPAGDNNGDVTKRFPVKL